MDNSRRKRSFCQSFRQSWILLVTREPKSAYLPSGTLESYHTPTMSDDNTLTVDIVSDVICPWCFIGKRRLERALPAIPREKTGRGGGLPFQLNPQMPAGG